MLATALEGASDVLDTIVKGSLTVVRTARTEATASLAAMLDAHEALQRSTWRILREVVESAGTTSHAAVESIEALAAALARAGRETRGRFADLLTASAAPRPAGASLDVSRAATNVRQVTLP